MSDTSLIDRQLEIEQEAISLGAERYRRLLAAGEDKMPPGMELVRRAVAPLAAAIREFCADAFSGKPGRHVSISKFAAQFDADALAFITARHLVRSLGSPRPMSIQSVALELTRTAEDTLNWDVMKTESPALFERVSRKLEKSPHAGYRHTIIRYSMNEAKVSTIKWGTAEKLRLGVALIQLAIETTGFAEIQRPPARRKGQKLPDVIVPTEKVCTWLEQAHNHAELSMPLYGPMIVPPQRRTTPWDGGYLTRALRTTLIKTRKKAYLEELSHQDIPLVYQAVNALQETRWSINTAVLRVAREVWDGGGRIGGMPSREPRELPPRNFSEDTPGTDERVVAWKRQAALIYDANVRARGKRIVCEAKLRTAEKYAEEATIYFPHAMDWRGRLYPIATHLNPQGDDLAKGLIQLSDGVPLGETGAYWLAVHGANSFGVDKVSFEERVQWVLEHHSSILEAAVNPADGTRWWAQADSPWQFLAFCFEWAGYTMQGDSYASHLAVSWDGACNGLQNYSAMLRDPVGGAAVGLVPSDTPADVYTAVMQVSQGIVDGVASTGVEVAKKFAGGKLSRRLTKRNTMTVPYSVSRYGMSEQLFDEFRKMQGELEEALSNAHGEEAAEVQKALSWVSSLSYPEAIFLADCNHEAIGQVVVAARQAMDWLKKVSKVVAADGLPVSWTTPAGLTVLQDYRITVGKRADFQVAGMRYQLMLTSEGSRIDTRKQSAGIAPNFIHSLDASHLMLTINRCLKEGIKDFAMVHDSYGTHAARAEDLSRCLREAFVEQYSGDVLGEFLEDLSKQLPPELVEKLPERPPMGDLELAGVLHSDYFFA
jgi:DNA-directed RNA polymerase, mitochondrial